MKNLFIPLLLGLIIGFSSCKKCVTCTLENKCADCDISGTGISICEEDLGSPEAFDSYITAIELSGGNCTLTSAGGKKEEKICHIEGNAVSQNTAITARTILESEGFVCK